MIAPLLQWSTAPRVAVRLCGVAIATVLASTIAQPALAQIVPDASLGDAPSSVVRESVTRARIEGGLISETNLFHSFQDFNIEAGDRVYFAPASSIETILTRVTGNWPSNILGTLGVSGDANLFFLNPNGVIFGAEAQLDIGGSFLATSAESMQFGTQGTFSATNPQIPDLLTVSPSALFFSNSPPRQIINRSVASSGMTASGNPTSDLPTGLSVPNGENLLLAGGEVLIDGGGLTAPGGHIHLVGIAGPGQIVIDNGIAPPSFTVPEAALQSDVTLQNEALLAVTSDDGGRITLEGENVGVLGGSRLFAGITPNSGSANSQGGDITLRANNQLTIEGPGFTIQNNVGDGATGNAGGLFIEARDFIAQNVVFMRLATFGNGNVGPVSLQIEETATFTNSSSIFNDVASPNGAQAGGISIAANSLNLLEGAEFISSVRPDARGQAGGVRLEIQEAIVIDGVDADGFSSGIFATSRPDSVGFSGNVFVYGNSLEMTRGARIQTGTRGRGNSGNVTVEIDDLFFLDGSDSSESVTGIFTDLDNDGVGRGGDIRVDAGTLSVNNGANFTANTFSQGDAGDITVNVQDVASFEGVNNDGLETGSSADGLVSARSGLFSAVGESRGDSTVPAFGNAGIITLNATNLSLTDGAAFGTSVISDSVGNAAPIRISVDDNVIVSGLDETVGASGIFTEVQPGAVGNAREIEISAGSVVLSQGAELSASIASDGVAGEISIDTRRLDLDEGSQVLVTTSGAGDAGNILIEGSDRLTITGKNSGLFANTTENATGNSGSVFLSPNRVILQDGAQIAVNSQGTGEGGNIQLEADNLVLNNALISAETASNQGGDITLLVNDAILLRNASNLSASAGTAEAGGDGGNLTIESDFLVAPLDEDNNITANAFSGRGGNVQVTATGIYGIDFQTTDLPGRNDITASSTFGAAGVVTLDAPEIDPTSGSVELPSDTGVLQISQRCNAGEGISRFVSSGRGGIPLGPEDMIAPQDLWEELYVSDSTAAPTTATHPLRALPALSSTSQILEAQDWQQDSHGNVQLIANPPATAQRLGTLSLPATCSLQDTLRGAL